MVSLGIGNSRMKDFAFDGPTLAAAMMKTGIFRAAFTETITALVPFLMSPPHALMTGLPFTRHGHPADRGTSEDGSLAALYINVA